jgi:hypothetical protein
VQIYLSNDSADLQSVHAKIGLVSSICKKTVNSDIFPQRYRRFAIRAGKYILTDLKKIQFLLIVGTGTEIISALSLCMFERLEITI